MNLTFDELKAKKAEYEEMYEANKKEGLKKGMEHCEKKIAALDKEIAEHKEPAKEKPKAEKKEKAERKPRAKREPKVEEPSNHEECLRLLKEARDKAKKNKKYS